MTALGLAALTVIAWVYVAFVGDQPVNGVGVTAGAQGVVKRSDLVQRLTIAGAVVPARKTVVTAPYSGYVRKLFVKIGDQLKAGDPIVSISQSLVSSDPVFPLRAPFPGTVVQVEKAEGEFVRENDTKEFILRIDDMSRLYVVANAAEIDRAKMQAGQEALIKASAILDRSYKGVVRELSLAARDKEQWGNSQTEFTARIEVMDADSQLRPGMSVVMDIVAQKREGVLVLGHEFLHKDGEQYYVVLKDGSRRDVKLGLQNEEATEILSGVDVGDQVLPVDFTQLAEEAKGI